jgi:outer membrane protein assembly factor BamB
MRNAMLCLVVLALISAPMFGGAVDLAKSSGVQGGIIVHVGCGDGVETARLMLNQQYLVHGLDASAANVAAARKTIMETGLYGKISVSGFDGKTLPYTNDLINLVIDSTGTVARSEIMRVLVPGGVAFIGGKKLVKPRSPDIGEWNHYLNGADNNAVTADKRVDIPRSIQWVSVPKWGRSHEEMASMSATVTANGRVFFVVDESPLASIRFLSKWSLVARDAFNGTLLWKRPIEQWNDHLRHFRSGPTHLPRRLVAVGDTVYATLGLAAPVLAIDTVTGETIRQYEGTERTEEILIDNGVMYLVVGTSEVNRRGGGLFERNEPKPTDFRFITAINAKSGEQLWKKDFTTAEFVLPLSLTVKGPNVYYQSITGVTCLDGADGKQKWHTPRTTPTRRMSFSSPTVVATDNVLLCADKDTGETDPDKPATGTIQWGVHGWSEADFPRQGKCTLRAYAVADGKELWSAPAREGYNSPIDVFVINGIVWVGPDFQGYDLATGVPQAKINTAAPKVGMPHHRCYRNKASERFIFTGKSGIEVLSIDEKKWLSNNSWIRGTCQYGIMPANGFLYAPPDACACFLTVKAPGYFAAAPQRDPSGQMPFPARPVLEKGPAFGQISQSSIGNSQSNDWPMYRHDPARSGASATQFAPEVAKKWTTSLGGKLTQPVIAGGKVFLASVDTHTVYALSAGDGKQIWQYTTGGRIDSSPTIYKGTVLVGSADGWLYCLRASDGALAWRFRAAPKDRLVSVYDQLESAWPVHGSVMVQNDTIYVTAGRSSYMDGGIVLYRVDPATGEQLSRTMLYHLDPDTGEQVPLESGFNMDGTTSDVLTGDGESVYLKYFAFGRDGKAAPEANNHLFSITGLLVEKWFVRSYWIVGKGKPGAGWGSWARAATSFPAGRILCFTDDKVYGYGRVEVASAAVGHKLDAYHLFSATRKIPPTPPPVAKPKPGEKKPRRPRKLAAPRKAPPLWTNTDSLIVRAMAMGGERIALAGPVDLGRKSEGAALAFANESEARAAFEGKKGVFLRIVNAADGKTVSQISLPAMPAFDGMSTAGGKLYISLKDGTVTCFGK